MAKVSVDHCGADHHQVETFNCPDSIEGAFGASYTSQVCLSFRYSKLITSSAVQIQRFYYAHMCLHNFAAGQKQALDISYLPVMQLIKAWL
jgi:hypothetical protein